MNSDALLELLIRSDDATIVALRMTELRPQIDAFLKSQHYWYLRTQQLVDRSLEPRYGSDWETAYSLLKMYIMAGYSDVYGDLLSVQVLLEIGHDVSGTGIMPLRVAVVRSNVEVYSLLLPLIDPTQEENVILALASSRPERVEILRMLLADGRCDPSVPAYIADDGYRRRYRLPLAVAVSNGNLSGVKLLLSDPRVDPTPASIIQSVLNIGDVTLRTQILLILLSDLRVNPNLLLERAAAMGDVAVLDVILSDDRLDVTWNNYEYLEDAMQNSAECLVYVLYRTGIDPAFQNNRLAYSAIQEENVLVLIALLSDRRVIPEFGMLIFALEEGSQGCLHVLLQDGRINPGENIALLLSSIKTEEQRALLLSDYRVISALR